MKALRTLSVPLCGVLSLFPASSVFADTFGTGANEFTIDFVSIGNPGNAPDTTGAPNPAGAVPYGYRMGTYEVSRDMIEKASNAGGLGIMMFDMSGFGGNGVNRPATGVTWFEAAAFVNWLNTSTGHQSAYDLSGSSLSLWSSADAWQAGGENLYRHKDAYYFLPNENEWYKAAYYSPGGVYYNYPTGSDSAPLAVAGGTTAGTAVYGQWSIHQGPADIGNAGGLSPYGTMGQGGNVWEWLEGPNTAPNDSGAQSRGMRGGDWFQDVVHLESSYWFSGSLPSDEFFDAGFRVAAVPEPLETAGTCGSLLLGFALWRRRSAQYSVLREEKPLRTWGTHGDRTTSLDLAMADPPSGARSCAQPPASSEAHPSFPIPPTIPTGPGTNRHTRRRAGGVVLPAVVAPGQS